MPPRNQRVLPEVVIRPEVLSFSGHETFVFRYGWMKKAVDATDADMGNPRIFSEEDAIAVFGVGKNMVRSIRHWGLSGGVIEEEPKSRGALVHSTELGKFIFGPGGQDQFLEDPNTLWVLHWRILSNLQKCTTWHWAFNGIPSNEFTHDQLVHLIQEEIRRRNTKGMPSSNTLKRDVDVFLRTYIAARTSRGAVAEDSLDCPLVELQLIEELGDSGVFQIKRGPKNSVSDLVFVYALVDFWDRAAAAHQDSLAFTEIAYGKSSPGIAFKLDENSLAERLERLEQTTNGDLLYTETAGLKQVYRKQQTPKLEYLKAHYESSASLAIGVRSAA